MQMYTRQANGLRLKLFDPIYKNSVVRKPPTENQKKD